MENVLDIIQMILFILVYKFIHKSLEFWKCENQYVINNSNAKGYEVLKQDFKELKEFILVNLL